MKYVGKSLEVLKCLGWNIVDPISKTLACNVKGMGAMANLKDILLSLQHAIKIVRIKNENENRKDSDNFNTKVLKLQENWKKELKLENAQDNYDLFLSILLSPVTMCICIALFIEFHDLV